MNAFYGAARTRPGELRALYAAAALLSVEWLRCRNTLSCDGKTRCAGAGRGEIKMHFQGWIEMKLIVRALAVLPVVLPALMVVIGHAQAVTEIGGQKIVTLTRAAVSTTRPEFTSVTILPGRGM